MVNLIESGIIPTADSDNVIGCSIFSEKIKSQKNF